MPPRKSAEKVCKLDGSPLEPDVITDADYRQALRRQEITLLAQGEERKALGQLRVRIERGAVETSERYYFDKRLGLVRRKDAVTRKGPGQAGPVEDEGEETGS